jgi:hypothetical protein
MSSEIEALLSSVNVKTDWQPTPELMLEVFSIISDSVLSENSYSRSDSSNYTRKIINPDIILWHWQTSKVNRSKTIERLISWYRHTDYYSGFRSGIGEDNKSSIKSILSATWDVLPEDSTSAAVQGLRVSISSLLQDPSMEINFAQKLMEANLAGNKELAQFWTREGMDKSKDPAFFSMAWARVDRQKGYTDARNHIIHSASKCYIFPESIIDDLTSGGHNKNRSSLINIMIDKIEDCKSYLSRVTLTEEEKEAKRKYILYCQSILAKFVSCEDHYIQQRLIPHLKREDLIFAAPVASKLGLGNLVDRYMNPGSYEEKRYRY